MFSTYLHSKTTKSQTSISGFGLIELMVSISIMAVIMAVVLARHDKFNGVVLLRSQAYQVALQLREIQLSAVSATSRNVSGTSLAGEYRSVLGVYFSTAEKNKYQIFQDANNNFRYDVAEQFGQQGIIDPRFEIRAIRASGNSIASVSVVFERPDFDARFFGPGGELPASQIEVDIAKVGESGTGSDVVRTVEITATGQIAVK